MNISITGRHLEVTPSLKDYIKKKVEKIKHYFDRIMNVHVILEVHKLSHLAEVTVTSDEKTFFCEVTSADMYSSIDLLFDKVERQVRRNKEKMYAHKGIRSIAKNFEIESSEDSADEGIYITKVKEVKPKPMTDHEAILQLSLNKHSFEIFHEEIEGITSESVALKRDANLFSVIQKNNSHWVEREVQLKENKIVEMNKINTDIHSYNLEQAVAQLEAENDTKKYVIFYDPETNSLNILYYRKNHSLGLLTSGGKI